MEESITTAVTPGYNTTGYPNHDFDWCAAPRYVTLIISAVFPCICLCGLVGNVLVVWFLGCRMKRNPFTVYVLNLAVADSSLLLLQLARMALHLISAGFCIRHNDFLIAKIILFLLFLFCYFAGMYLLTAMSVERCLAAVFPVWYRCHRPKHCSGIMCGVLWALALCFTSVWLGCRFSGVYYQLIGIISITNFVLFSLLPLLSNLALFIKLRCGSQRRHPGKLYVAVLLSLLFLVVLGLPFSVEIFLVRYYPHTFYLSFLLASLNSSINPLLYFLLGSCLQHRSQCSLRVALRRLFEEEATSEERSQEPGDAVEESSV